MKKNQNQKNFILMGADSGTTFTLAVVFPLLVAVVYTIILMALKLANNAEFLQSAFYTYTGFALPALSLGVVAFYTVKKNNLDFRLASGMVKCQPKYYLIALLLAFGALFGLGWVNEKFIEFLQGLGFTLSQITLPKRHFGDFLLCTLIVCILPCVFEECIFRGLVFNGLKRLGDIFAVLVCGALFSLFHKNPSQTLYQFILGCTLSLLTLKSGSVLPAMLFHFINNFYIVIFYFVTPQNYAFDSAVQIVLLVLGLIAFILAVVYLIFKCQKPKAEQELSQEFLKIASKKSEIKNFFIFSALGIVACVLMWALNLTA